MIDWNYMVDRRIVLEAKLLQKANHHVLLAATYGPGENESIIDGLRIARFNESDLAIYGQDRVFSNFDNTKHFLTTQKPNTRYNRSEKRFNKIYGSTRPFLGKILSGGIAALSAPYFASKRIAALSISNAIKVPIVLGLQILALDFKSILNAFSFKKANVDLITDSLQKLNHDARQHFQQKPLTHWESTVFHFALGLDRVDVIHVHDLCSLRIGVLISNRLNTPLIYDAHELYPYQPGMSTERREQLLAIERCFINYCTEMVVINAQQAEIIHRDHQYKKFNILTNATEQPENFDIRQRYRLIHDRLNLPDDAKTLLFMGGINKIRFIHHLLEGIALSNYPVHMIFLTWGIEITEFRSLAKQLGLENRVHFIDPVPWSEIVLWAASCDVGVLPYQAKDLNTQISSPNKMYEFITAGTPMIGSSELINVEHVVNTEGFGVLLPFHAPEDYAKAINIIFDPEQGGVDRFRPALIEKAHQYSWENESRDFAAMYERVTQDNPI